MKSSNLDFKEDAKFLKISFGISSFQILIVCSIKSLLDVIICPPHFELQKRPKILDWF